MSISNGSNWPRTCLPNFEQPSAPLESWSTVGCNCRLGAIHVQMLDVGKFRPVVRWLINNLARLAVAQPRAGEPRVTTIVQVWSRCKGHAVLVQLEICNIDVYSVVQPPCATLYVDCARIAIPLFTCRGYCPIENPKLLDLRNICDQKQTCACRCLDVLANVRLEEISRWAFGFR